MGEIGNSINEKARITLSRNTPVAFIVGVTSFLGSYLAEELLNHRIQVVGLDSPVNTRDKVQHLFKNKHFHLINDPGLSSGMDFGRLDYAFFIPDPANRDALLTSLDMFLSTVKLNTKKHTVGTVTSTTKSDADAKEELQAVTKIIFASSILLYNSDLSNENENLKEAEAYLARVAKEEKLNARIVRLASVFGPKMEFKDNDPVVRLIQATLQNQLQKEQTSLEFSSRAFYIDDATALLIKTAFSGSTANKIYDGALLHPLKVADIKQILLDPVWYEEKGFLVSELPPLPTPNLQRTMKELSWSAKTNIVKALKKTIAYFKENNIQVPELAEEGNTFFKSPWQHKSLFEGSGENEKKLESAESKKLDEEEAGSGKAASPKEKTKNKRRVGLGFIFGVLLIGYGLIYPAANLSIQAVSLKYHLEKSEKLLRSNEYDKAKQEILIIKSSLGQFEEMLTSFAITKKIKPLESYYETAERLLALSREAILGVEHSVWGGELLFNATKVISGQSSNDPKPLYSNAISEFTLASQKLSLAKLLLNSNKTATQMPKILQEKVSFFEGKIDYYDRLIGRSSAAAKILPKIISLEGKKSYLVLVLSNLELRPGGGIVVALAKLDFENGKLLNLSFEDLLSLDSKQAKVVPPQEIVSDLKTDNWVMKDVLFDPDFPTSARQAQFLYSLKNGEKTAGVIAMDINAISQLLEVYGDREVTGFNETINSANIKDKFIQYASSNGLENSSGKNFPTVVSEEVLNQIFFAPSKNYHQLIEAISNSLSSKHMVFYFSDPDIFSYASSEDWIGLMPRQTEKKEGRVEDFLAVVEANMGKNKANFYLKKEININTQVNIDGEVRNRLKINYQNSSPSEEYPAGTYKNRARVYLPDGSKLIKASLGEADLTSETKPFKDYGRSGFSWLINIPPQVNTSFIIEYNLPDKITNKEGKTQYLLNIIKQAGTDNDSLTWQMSVPGSYKTDGETNISTQLNKNTQFQVGLAPNP